MDSQMNLNQRIMAAYAKPVEAVMLSKERWEEVRQMGGQGLSVSAIARQLEIDRKTVRKLLSEPWRAYTRPERPDTLLASHAEFLQDRAAQVDYSARILYQELCRDRGFQGSYETVKRFVVPLRQQAVTAAQLCQRRFETEPGQQSQIDWGQSGIYLHHRPVILHIFVMTLGYSRRGYYRACANEQLGLFLESHEAAFEYFGGLTRELLYDRPRTVCRPVPGKGWRWNDTFREFARHWGFEPRVCAPYRAQTKGKVESGVKYVKRNFLPGRTFTDMVDVQEQMNEWVASCHYIEHGENIVILGPPGVGKTHLAVGLGIRAIEAGYRVLFSTAATMIAALAKAASEGRLEEKLKFYTVPRLLIIDEIGYLPIDRQGANLFFQLISRRYEKGPMILTSNQSFGAWAEVFGDRVIATAILDRVLHHAITMNIRGNSYRLKDKLKAGLVRPAETPTVE